MKVINSVYLLNFLVVFLVYFKSYYLLSCHIFW